MPAMEAMIKAMCYSIVYLVCGINNTLCYLFLHTKATATCFCQGGAYYNWSLWKALSYNLSLINKHHPIKALPHSKSKQYCMRHLHHAYIQSIYYPPFLLVIHALGHKETLWGHYYCNNYCLVTVTSFHYQSELICHIKGFKVDNLRPFCFKPSISQLYNFSQSVQAFKHHVSNAHKCKW